MSKFRPRTGFATGILVVFALLLSGCSSGAESGNKEATLTFTWWGNEQRASWMKEAIAVFETANPGIKVNGSFADFEGYWQKRATEAAGGGLPDVMLFDYSQLSDYGSRNLLLNLQANDSRVDLSTLPPSLLGAGKVGNKTVAVPTGTNIFSVLTSPTVANEAKVEIPATPGAWNWDQFNTFIADISMKLNGKKFGGPDYAGQLAVLELQLRQEGLSLYTADGKLGFDRERLKEFWGSTQKLRESHGVMTPADAEQVAPLDPITAGTSATLFGWSSTIPNFLTNAKVDTLQITPPPSSDPTNLGLYLKPSLLLSASAKTDYPTESAKFIDFMINDPAVAKIFGSSLGLPASSAQRDVLTLTGVNKQIADYQTLLESKLGDTPPPPPKGSGSLNTHFLRVFGDILYGRITVDQGVDQWFTEAESVLGKS